MSVEYNYFVGYKKDGKIHILGPYNHNKELCPVLNKSRSFASKLYELFRPVRDDEISEELADEFMEHDSYSNASYLDCRVLAYKDLPSDDFIKSGYVLEKQVMDSFKEDEYFDGFYDVLSPEEYAVKAEHELKYGWTKPDDTESEYLSEADCHSAKEYVFFAWPDYSSIEFDAFVIRNAVSNLAGCDIIAADLFIIVSCG